MTISISTKKLQHFPGEEVRGESQSEKRRNENQTKTGEKYTQLLKFYWQRKLHYVEIF